jgi:hypothetical protein
MLGLASDYFIKPLLSFFVGKKQKEETLAFSTEYGKE